VPSPDVPATTVVGRPQHKVDAVRLVKGNPAFTDDVELRGMLYARVLRSPHAHARIVAIDDTEARALAGVHAVVHHANTPRVRYASGGQSWPNPHPWDQVSFDDKVRHVGDRVAAVAADTVEIAEEACRQIEVTYEVLPAVFDAHEAIAGGAPVIHDEPDSIGIGDASSLQPRRSGAIDQRNRAPQSHQATRAQFPSDQEEGPRHWVCAYRAAPVGCQN